MFFGKKNKKRSPVVMPDRGRVLLENHTGRKSMTPKSGGSVWEVRLLNVLTILFALGFVGVLIYVFFFSSFLMISVIKIAGVNRLNVDVVRGQIATEVTGKYWEIFSKDNIVLANSARLQTTLKQRFGIIDSVVVAKKFPNELVVSVVEKKPSLFLCSQGTCYVVDEKGLAFSKESFVATPLDENMTLSLTDNGNRAVQVGEVALHPDYVAFILQGRERLKSDLNLDVQTDVRAPQIASGDVFFTTTEGWRVYFNQETGLNKEIEMLKLVLKDKIAKNQRGDLEYIDLRADNKVYYKLKNTEQSQQQ